MCQKIIINLKTLSEIENVYPQKTQGRNIQRVYFRKNETIPGRKSKMKDLVSKQNGKHMGKQTHLQLMTIVTQSARLKPEKYENIHNMVSPQHVRWKQWTVEPKHLQILVPLRRMVRQPLTLDCEAYLKRFKGNH